MMSMPPSSQDLITGTRSPIAAPWSQFIRKLIEAVGLSPAVRVFRDLSVDANQVNMDGSAVTQTAVSGGVELPEYPAGADEGTHLCIRLPNDYREGTPLQPWLEWAPTDANAGTVEWRLEYLVAEDGAVMPASASLDEQATAPGVAGQVNRVEFDEIDADLRRGNLINIRLWRRGTADTYASGAWLLSCGLKYAVDGVGTVEVHP